MYAEIRDQVTVSKTKHGWEWNHKTRAVGLGGFDTEARAWEHAKNFMDLLG